MKGKILSLAFAASMVVTPAFAQQQKPRPLKKPVPPVFQVEKPKADKALETTVGNVRVRATILPKMVGINDTPRVQQFDVNPFDQLGISYPDTKRNRQ